MFYSLYLNTDMIRMNGLAVNYAVNILEEIDRLSYDEVDNELDFVNKYDIPEDFTLDFKVRNYATQENGKEDIIKIISLTINYHLLGTDEEFNVKKLKIKEI